MRKIFTVFFVVTLFFIWPYSVIAKPPPEDTGGGSSAVLGPPKDWLVSLFPVNGMLGGRGLYFLENSVVPFLVAWAVFILIFLSIVFIIIGGIGWTMSGGNKEGLAKAKNTLTYALLGLALGIGSFIILNFIGNVFGVKFFGS